MKEKWIVYISILVLLVTAIWINFDIRVINVEEGKKVVYTIPADAFDDRPGATACGDWSEELEPVFGENGITIEQYNDGKSIVWDTPYYDFKYGGRDLDNGQYVLCTITTSRIFTEGNERSEEIRISKYICYDDGDNNSRERGKVLWDTLEEEYSNGILSFNRYE